MIFTTIGLILVIVGLITTVISAEYFVSNLKLYRSFRYFAGSYFYIIAAYILACILFGIILSMCS